MELASATFENVPRKVFNRLCNSLAGDDGYVKDVLVHYQGTDRRGRVVIEEMPGSGVLRYKSALAEFVSAYFDVGE